MAKLALLANPTFRAKVPIPVAGAAPVLVEFEFKHRTFDQMQEWSTGKEAKDRSNLDTVMGCALGWFEMDVEFSRENVATFLQNYIAAGGVIVETYMRELGGARLGN